MVPWGRGPAGISGGSMPHPNVIGLVRYSPIRGRRQGIGLHPILYPAYPSRRSGRRGRRRASPKRQCPLLCHGRTESLRIARPHVELKECRPSISTARAFPIRVPPGRHGLKERIPPAGKRSVRPSNRPARRCIRCAQAIVTCRQYVGPLALFDQCTQECSVNEMSQSLQNLQIGP